ncbi:MAG TPA: DUF1572 family protein [Bacteroidota bacterium]|jgi:hypothetical protein
MDIAKNYLDSAVKRFRRHKDLGEKAMAQVSEENIGRSTNEDSNSIATIVKQNRPHLKPPIETFVPDVNQ